MELVRHGKWQRIFLPGLIFQSMVIGGGYGTGAEVARYFGISGTLGGLLSLLVTAVLWSAVCVVTFELVRLYRTYDYHSLTKLLLGRWCVLYEICYVVDALLVLAVVDAASGSMCASLFGCGRWVGTLVLSGVVIVVVVAGTGAVEKALEVWSYLLYAVYVVVMAACFLRWGGVIESRIAGGSVYATWLPKGAQYACYNLGIVPALLYSTAGAESRRESVVSGVLAGVLAAAPAVLLYLCLTAFYPEYLSAEIPINLVFERLNLRWLYYLFELVLFGTLAETGLGFIKAVDDRVEVSWQKDHRGSLPKWLRPLITASFVAAGVGISAFGLTAIIEKGYGTLCWGMCFTYALPLMTVGVGKIRAFGRRRKKIWIRGSVL